MLNGKGNWIYKFQRYFFKTSFIYRDKIFFEIYHLDLCDSKNEEISKKEQNLDESIDFGMTSESEINTEEDTKMIVDYKIEDEHDSFESDEESVKNEEMILEEELNDSNNQSDKLQNNIVF